MAVQVLALTHLGNVRKNNEDVFFHGDVNEQVSLAMVADGVGGKNYGEVASAKAKEVVADLLQQGKFQVAADPEMRSAILDMTARRAHQDIQILINTTFVE